MDKTAIQRIEELAAHGPITGRHTPAVVLPSGCGIHSLEHLLEFPLFQRVAYTTERLEDFCRYVSAESLTEQMSAVFIRPDGSGATGIIDFGDHGQPLWGHHTAELTMCMTPEFAALNAACKRDLSQRDLIDWLEDWQHIVTPFDEADQSMTTARAIQLIQRIDIKAIANKTSQVGNFSSEQSTLGRIEAKSGETTPPALFGVTCQVYPCTRSRDVRARLTLKTSGDKPAFRLRIIGEDALRKEVADEIDLEIKTRLGDKARTFVGAAKKA